MTGNDFLATAGDLLRGSREADWRSAVSRAYYAAFHAAARLLRGCGFRVPDADRAHAYLWLRLSNCGDAELSAAGAALKELRAARNRADYDLTRPADRRRASDDFDRAGELVRAFDEAAAAPELLAGFVAAVRAYERDVLRDVTWHG